MDLYSPIGLIAGNGTFPLEFARNAKSQGLDVIAVAHVGETDPLLEREVRSLSWVKVGQVGRIIRLLKRSGVRQVAFAGGIRKFNLFRDIRLDWRGVRLLARLGSAKDDVVLRGVAEEIEREGMIVIGGNVLLEQSVPQVGLVTKRDLTDQEKDSARVGWEAARATGAVDIGQTVVVNRGVVAAVEAVEGTDRTILRAGELTGKGAVVVKLAKLGQDLRFDLPTIGVPTLDTMQTAGATAIVLEAGKSLILDPEETRREADRRGIALRVCASVEDI